ncbi:MAG: aldolase [Balneolaceae bacterium]|nr:MAG: aldolase [Balneolaceae bacterium]
MSTFDKETIISLELYRQITDIRVHNPGYIKDVADQRKRRAKFVPTGKMNIVAADHPARGSLSVGDDLLAMADRHSLLARLVTTLQSKWVDGVLGSMDILEDLLILHGLMKEMGNGFLDEKLLITSLNRGGLPGGAWELDDPITGTDAKTCAELGLDAAKMLLRIDFSSRDTLKTIEYCAAGVRDINSQNLPIILEPLPVVKHGNSYKVVKEPDPLIRLITVTSALGDSSRNIWLKIPFTKDFERVAASTTLPIVILGGDRNTGLDDLLYDLKQALKASHQVRGAMYGRNVLYPENAHPKDVAEAIGKLVHEES